jgi:dGTPase
MQNREVLLAPYAMTEAQSLGRRYDEPDHPYRGKFQRDRDRVLHASAFRRLTAKTQVLVSGTNDHHRTRLTHTLEVSQVSRTIARELGLNEDLTEAIALVHDVGHPPFGHAGEAALDRSLKAEGGFEHNRQGLRIVELLEQRYPAFPGLNLTWEVRESLAFHSKRPDAAEVRPYRQGSRQPTLEAQVVDAADSLVYEVHDLEDAFGVELIELADVQPLQFWQRAERELIERYGRIAPDRLLPAILRSLLARRERDLLEETRRRIMSSGVGSPMDARQLSEPLVQERVESAEAMRELHDFLGQRVYRHPRVLEMSQHGARILTELFQLYAANPDRMPQTHARRAAEVGPARAAGDYLSGMTDRLALAQYQTLFQ